MFKGGYEGWLKTLFYKILGYRKNRCLRDVAEINQKEM